MKFEIINEELKIASCRLSDLTMEQVYRFLNQWEKGARIGALTMFYDDNSGYVVLNRDNTNYRFYLDIADAYLGAGEEGRKMLEEKAPESLHETLVVLGDVVMRRNTEKEISVVRKNYIDELYMPILNEIIKQSGDKWVSACTAFLYGVICGKRTERVRGKGGKRGVTA